MHGSLEENNMSEQHADQGYRKFWPTMKGMNWKERIKHILYYYGKYAIIIAFVIYMCVDLVYEAYREKPENILAGTAINVHISVDMERTLTEDVFSFVGGEDSEKQEVTLVPNEINPSDLHIISALQTKLLAGDYDYALMDQTALEMLLSMQALPDLNLLLPEEKLAEFEDHFISVQTEGETYPVAIDITGTPLAAGCTYDGERIYLGFPVTVNTVEAVEPFYDYLMEQGLLEMP